MPNDRCKHQLVRLHGPWPGLHPCPIVISIYPLVKGFDLCIKFGHGVPMDEAVHESYSTYQLHSGKLCLDYSIVKWTIHAWSHPVSSSSKRNACCLFQGMSTLCKRKFKVCAVKWCIHPFSLLLVEMWTCDLFLHQMMAIGLFFIVVICSCCK